MNRFALQLLKRMAGIDVDELQTEFNRVQGENVKVTTQLKYALQDLMQVEKRVDKLQEKLAQLQVSGDTDQTQVSDANFAKNSFSEAIHNQLIEAENKINVLTSELEDWKAKYTDLRTRYEQQTELLVQANLMLKDATELVEEPFQPETIEPIQAEPVQAEEEDIPQSEETMPETTEDEILMCQITDEMNAVLDEDVPRLPQNVAVVKYLKGKLIEMAEQMERLETANQEKIDVLTARFEDELAKKEQIIQSLQETVVLETEREESLQSQEPEEVSDISSVDTEAPVITLIEASETAPMESNERPAPSDNDTPAPILFDNEPTEKTEEPDETPVQTDVTTSAQTDTLFIVPDEIEAIDSPEKQTAPPLTDRQTIEPEPTESEPAVTEIHPELCNPESMQEQLQALVCNHDFVRVTTNANGQFLFASQDFKVIQQLFEWGVEGIDFISNENRFINHENLVHIQGLKSPYFGKSLTCNFEDETNNLDVIADALLMAICNFHPIHIRYKGKNGIISETNLYYLCEMPDTSKYKLPYPKMFERMIQDMPDLTQLAALSSSHHEAKVFQMNQLISIEIFDVFYTTSEGIDYLKKGIAKAQNAGLDDLVTLFTVASPKWHKLI